MDNREHPRRLDSLGAFQAKAEAHSSVVECSVVGREAKGKGGCNCDCKWFRSVADWDDVQRARQAGTQAGTQAGPAASGRDDGSRRGCVIGCESAKGGWMGGWVDGWMRGWSDSATARDEKQENTMCGITYLADQRHLHAATLLQYILHANTHTPSLASSSSS